MPLSPGTRLGPYQVASPLGAGGMGEVYAARDTRLERSVAIKVLPREFTDDAGRRARFEREAAAIASLSHPNICTLHDVGQQDGTMFLVMEKLDGATLAARLAQGPMTPAEAIACAIQIAEGLAFAHRAGVVHRDLKPANVMLTKTGAKLLDFGLAKVASGVTENPTARRSRSTARFSAPCRTWPPSNCRAATSMPVRTSSPLARCCTRWSRDSAPSPVRARPR